MKSLRQTTLETLGLGTVLEIFQKGKLPAEESALIDQVFGPAGHRGSLVISGGNGIVGSGKAMQLGSRLLPYDVPMVTLDMPDAPDGIGQQYAGLKGSFGPQAANQIMSNMTRLMYDGANLPKSLAGFNPKFVLEAIPEILNVKLEHYKMLRQSFPDVEIRSVTSGFPSSVLGVGILHPSFPHQINKIWEVVEDEPSAITQMLLALGLIPVPVGDYWSFILDILFCGITQAAIRYHRATNMPFWKIDKFVRKFVGPNPVRAHDAIGPGASFLTWSCLHHLSETYGAVFEPSPELVRRKESGENWYSSNRPSVDWEMPDEDEFMNWVMGPVLQMTSLMLHENRGHLTHMNTIGELCAQFSKGIIAMIREMGADGSIKRVEAYHKLHPEAASSCWFPQVFEQIDSPEWQQLYVNAEHDGQVGAITISRESINWDVINELNSAMDWLKNEGIKNVILTGDFHLSTQMVGADTSEFYPALEDEEQGFTVAQKWSQTARRLFQDFEVSVGFINGKRCLGGMMELMLHCHYIVAVDNAQLGMPEVTLPVVPGMEGCHWAFRKTDSANYGKLWNLLLTGKAVAAKNASGWFIDYAGPMSDALQKAWQIASGSDHGLALRKVNTEAVNVGEITGDLPPAANALMEAGRKAISDCVKASCGVSLSQALDIQAKHSAGFMTTKACHRGAIGGSYQKTMLV